jgi:hypothetical protein
LFYLQSFNINYEAKTIQTAEKRRKLVPKTFGAKTFINSIGFGSYVKCSWFHMLSWYNNFIVFQFPIPCPSPSSPLLPIFSYELSLLLETLGNSFHTIACLICCLDTRILLPCPLACGRAHLSSPFIPPTFPYSSNSQIIEFSIFHSS